MLGVKDIYLAAVSAFRKSSNVALHLHFEFPTFRHLTLVLRGCDDGDHT